MYQVDFLCIFLVKTLIIGYDSFEYNLTTAIIPQSTSPKPSIYYQKFNVEIEISTTSDIVRSADARRVKKKNLKSFVWPWDSWCLLQPKEGKCNKQIKRFYYNLQLDRCATFSYSGCYGNENNFVTFAECEKYCKGSSLINIITSNLKSNYCHLQPDPGLCLSLIQKYYYDINELACKKFTYGGCGGNRNNFHTMLSCMDTCDTVLRNN